MTTDFEAHLSDEDRALLESVPEEARPALARRLASAPDRRPRSPRPDQNQGYVPHRQVTEGEVSDARRAHAAMLFEQYASQQLRGMYKGR